MMNKDLLKTSAGAFGVALDETALQRFAVYADFLREYNEKVNLTAITDPNGIVVKHFADSLALLKYVDLPNGAAVCDVGTGAGFPGMAILIARPDLKVTLMDSVNKKLEFLRQLAAKLEVSPEIVHIRAEDAGHDPRFREQFDCVTARAVSQLNKLSEYCVPLVKQNGVFVPLKAPLAEEEAAAGKSAAGKLGCRLKERFSYEIPGGDGREVLIFEKKSHTPTLYPRKSAVISKSPLK